MTTLKIGLYELAVKFLHLPKGRKIYLYRRQIPKDLRHHYSSSQYLKSLETSNEVEAIKRFGSARAVIELIVERNKPVAPCLMQRKAMGQHYQWLEANLVFHVAHQLSVRGVPAITVYDEFIVREQDAELADMVMYGAWPADLPELSGAPWNRSRQIKSEAV